MEWPPWSPDLNSIENLWSIVKMKLYVGGKQYNSQADLGEAIKTNMTETDPVEERKLQNQWYWLLFRRRVTIWECKDSKTYHALVICPIIGFYHRFYYLFIDVK